MDEGDSSKGSHTQGPKLDSRQYIPHPIPPTPPDPNIKARLIVYGWLEMALRTPEPAVSSPPKNLIQMKRQIIQGGKVY